MRKPALVMLLVASAWGAFLPRVAAGAPAELSVRRFGLFIGANKGGPGRITLRYAQEDARAVMAVLEDLGGMQTGDAKLVEQPDRAGFFREMKALGERAKGAQGQFRKVEVIVYYSGHSNEDSILLDGHRVTYSEFREAVRSIEADVRIAILDSCASGSFAQAKGVRPRTPFLMDAAYDMNGYAFMTSSSADEASQESSRLRGSFFTRNLIAGMRGAADMNLDGRITLTEAYQFAFDSTLEQTEKTAGGPQHPNYSIQMSGKGDVIITDLSRSDEMLRLGSDIGGKLYIHSRSNVLVAELNKPQGREVSIGLAEGDYRVLLIADGAIFEARASLKPGRSQALDRSRFERLQKIATRSRGDVVAKYLDFGWRRPGRWRIDVFGGAAELNPADLNGRTTFAEDLNRFKVDARYSYLRQTGNVIFFTGDTEGDLQPLRLSIPWGFRLRRSLTDWLDVSLGLVGFYGHRTSDFENRVSVVEASSSQYVYSVKVTDFRLVARGIAPVLGLHAGLDLGSRLRVEAQVSGGPLFAGCHYSFNDEEAPMSDLGEYYELPYNGYLEEKGTGIGWTLAAGAGLHLALGPRLGVFLEAEYAWQRVKNLTGPGTSVIDGIRLNWDGPWKMKVHSLDRPWGNFYREYASNYWPEEELAKLARPFTLDVSGFQARVGFSIRL
jgi:hypothetical protein